MMKVIDSQIRGGILVEKLLYRNQYKVCWQEHCPVCIHWYIACFWIISKLKKNAVLGIKTVIVREIKSMAKSKIISENIGETIPPSSSNYERISTERGSSLDPSSSSGFCSINLSYFLRQTWKSIVKALGMKSILPSAFQVSSWIDLLNVVSSLDILEDLPCAP